MTWPGQAKDSIALGTIRGRGQEERLVAVLEVNRVIIELLRLKIVQCIKAKKKLCRVELTPEAFVVIEAEAYLRGRTLKSIASEILSSNCSEE